MFSKVNKYLYICFTACFQEITKDYVKLFIQKYPSVPSPFSLQSPDSCSVCVYIYIYLMNCIFNLFFILDLTHNINSRTL